MTYQEVKILLSSLDRIATSLESIDGWLDGIDTHTDWAASQLHDIVQQLNSFEGTLGHMPIYELIEAIKNK